LKHIEERNDAQRELTKKITKENRENCKARMKNSQWPSKKHESFAGILIKASPETCPR
jgi:hypothetical protein